MADILVTSPYRPFTLPNQFKAVFNGYIYCGTVDSVDPSVSQVQAYKVNEDGSRIPVAQPLRTNAGGFLVYNGQPAKFVTDSNHSLLVRDSLGNQVWYAQDMASIDPSSAYVGVLHVRNFGVFGDGGDETAKIQSALDAAAGKVLQFEAGKTYGYTTLSIKPNSTIISNGATFQRVAPSVTHGIDISDGVSIDALSIETPGGATGDKAVLISGGGVSITKLSIIAAEQGIHSSTNWAVEVVSNTAGETLSDITIGYFYCKYFSSGVFVKNASHIMLNKALVEYYRTAFYLQDVSNSEFSNVTCRLTASTSYGRNGENGLLIESTLQSGSSHHLTFNNWAVANAGEHSYRLGGQLTIRNVWFNGCRSRLSGSAIAVVNPAATEWHGGCGFKILGGTQVANERHENIFFNSCVVNDVNQQFGTFPAGHGVNNFTPWLIIAADNVHLIDCVIDRSSTQYAARYGVLMTACDGVYITNPSFRDLEVAAVRPYEETPIVGYPYQNAPVLNLKITGGTLETTQINGGVPFYYQLAANEAHRNWSIKGTTLKGGTHALRIETPALGSFTNMSFDFTYVDSAVDDSTHTTPVVSGVAVGMLNVKAPFRPLAPDPSSLNGSVWQDTLVGRFMQKLNGKWIVANANTRMVTIADDAVATVVPPSDLDPGFLLISGSGTAKHMMAWYRATSSPASLKYAGAAQTVIVNTPMTGTTGTDGNITVGVQEDLIYIENRGGSTDNFIITFM